MNKQMNDQFLDQEEKDLIESFNQAIVEGKFKPSSPKEQIEKKQFWKTVVEHTEKRRAVTLRIQQRDIERLKVMARKKGLPYQTFIASSLHQLANGDLVERS
ncbi:MAG: hypothetical protein ACWA5U_10660 [bacterium]